MGMTGNLGEGFSWVISGGVIHPFLTNFGKAGVRQDGTSAGARRNQFGNNSVSLGHQNSLT